LGLKGPRATDWLTEQGIAFPAAANTWGGGSSGADTGLLVARLGTGEFFLEDVEGGDRLRRIAPASESHPPGVYPVLRQDAAFLLSGDGGADVLAQVCNVNFPALVLDSRPVIMTLMVGVAVLVVPRDLDGQRQYLIWCDPTFGPYLAESLGNIVIECGGNYRGVPI
jgi:sarcosine oxidase subunit gamma